MKVYTTGANSRLLNLLPNTANKALDIGCATGNMAAELKKYSIITDGVTHSVDEQVLAEKHCNKVWSFNVENGLPKDTQGPYDIVILSHILEHIANPNKLLEGIKKVLDTKGVVLCAIPNMLFIYNRLKLLRGKIEYSDYGLMDYTHIRWYTHKTLIETFNEYGFSMQSFYAEGNAPLGPLRRVIPKSVCNKIDRLFIRIAPSWFAWEYSFMFINQTDLKET